MKAAQWTVLSGLLALGACYHGKDDVPRMSGFGGSGGTASTSSSASSSTSSTAAGGAATGGTGGSADPCANALFCDDFEAYAPGSPPGGPWDSHADQGSLAVDTGRAHSGGRAVKISADAANSVRTPRIDR